MSVRYGLLALLEHGPRHGSRLRTEFESRTGAVWPLNIGQVYTTLGRLERDDLVTSDSENSSGRRLYRITDQGRAALAGWFARPVDRGLPLRDELAAKLVLATGTPGVDLPGLIRAQRRHTVATLRDHVRQRAGLLTGDPAGGPDLARLLALERLIARADAETRWLDHCAARLAGRAVRSAANPAAPDLHHAGDGGNATEAGDDGGDRAQVGAVTDPQPGHGADAKAEADGERNERAPRPPEATDRGTSPAHHADPPDQPGRPRGRRNGEPP